MRLVALVAGITLFTSLLAAETSTSTGQSAKDDQVAVHSLPIDSQKLSDEINGSYYHPSEIDSIQCAVTVDWPALFSGAKVKVPEERLQALDGLQVHYAVERNKVPETNFNWVKGRADTADQLEGGLKQMIAGFYQMYWPMMASTPVPRASDIRRVEPQSDGTLKIFESDSNNKIDITLDKRYAPLHWNFDTPVYKGTFDLEFSETPNAVSGDLRRLSSMHVVVNTGASTMNVKIHTDYQKVNGVNIPQHITYELVGAYDISLEFIGCSVTTSPKPKPSAAQ